MTTRLLYGHEDRLLPWAAERIGLGAFRRDAFTIGLERDGEVVAATVFDTFSAADCSMHLASDGTRRWLNRAFIVACYAYPFLQCGFESVTGIVPADNAAALSFNEHMGWTRIGVRRKAAPGGRDLIIMEMLRETCRWIPREGKQ